MGISLIFDDPFLHVLSDIPVAPRNRSHSKSCSPINSDLNRLIMDYLVIEGYKSAAEEFSKEADLKSPVDFQSIEDRTTIRDALQRGDVEEAITRVNDLNPEVRLVSLSNRFNERIILFMHHAEI